MTQDSGGVRKPDVWAEASAVPRAALKAPCRAGSQELLQRAGSWEASSGEPPFDLPGSRGVPLPVSQNACSGKDLRGHGAQPHWTDRANRALRGARLGQGHTGNGRPCSPRAASTPQSSSCFLSLSGKQTGRARSFQSLCCGGSISRPSRKVQRRLEWWRWSGGVRTAQGGEWVFKSQRRLYPLSF